MDERKTQSVKSPEDMQAKLEKQQEEDRERKKTVYLLQLKKEDRHRNVARQRELLFACAE
jgi:hypothetical protein